MMRMALHDRAFRPPTIVYAVAEDPHCLPCLPGMCSAHTRGSLPAPYDLGNGSMISSNINCTNSEVPRLALAGVMPRVML